MITNDARPFFCLSAVRVVQTDFYPKAQIATEADDKFCDIFLNYRKKNKAW